MQSLSYFYFLLDINSKQCLLKAALNGVAQKAIKFAAKQ